MSNKDDEALGNLIDAVGQVLGLAIEPAWKPAIAAHLRVALSHAASVAEFELPDEVEPAPVVQA